MNSKLHAVTDAAGRPLRMFLTAGQLTQLLEGLVDGLVLRLLLTPLHRLVLILQLVQLELEQVGQIVGVRATALASASALLLLFVEGHVALVRLFGLLQGTKGPLLRRYRFLGCPAWSNASASAMASTASGRISEIDWNASSVSLTPRFTMR